MAYAGARGDTAAEMQKALALRAGDAAHVAFAELLADWDRLAHPPPNAPPTSDRQMQKYYEQELEQRRIVLRVANRLWAQAGRNYRDAFLKLLRDDYGAPLAELDFARDAEKARVTINNWVANATEQKIKELIALGLVKTDTKLVLTNAIYFKAHWTKKFDEAATHEAAFFVAAGRERKASLMRREGSYLLAKLDGAMLLELPYGGGRLAMDVVLPNARDGLARVEEAYAKEGHGAWVKALALAHVDVMLPRFRISSSFELGETLGALGMPKAFKYPVADFSGMDGTRELFIGGVVHQASVDVDENGTEAAAATAVGIRAPCPRGRSRWSSAPTTHFCSSSATGRPAQSCSPGGSPTLRRSSSVGLPRRLMGRRSADRSM